VPCQASFYLEVLLECLLCNSLFGRACKSGQVKTTSWMVGLLVGEVADYSISC